MKCHNSVYRHNTIRLHNQSQRFVLYVLDGNFIHAVQRCQILEEMNKFKLVGVLLYGTKGIILIATRLTKKGNAQSALDHINSTQTNKKQG